MGDESNEGNEGSTTTDVTTPGGTEVSEETPAPAPDGGDSDANAGDGDGDASSS